MKTIYDIVKEHKDKVLGNVTPLHGFRVGDKVKLAPQGVKLFSTECSGEVIRINGPMVTFAKGQNHYDLESYNEYYLMPLEE